MREKGRCLGGKRVVRRQISSNELYLRKLEQLSVSCEHKPASLASKLICAALNSPQFVYSIQRVYTKEGHLWVTAKELKDGTIIYETGDGQDFVRKVRSIKKDKYLDFRRDERIKISISNNDDRKLNLLSRSLKCSKAELAAFLLHYGLDSSQIVMQIQNIYNVYRHLRVVPLIKDGTVTYILPALSH